MGGTGNDFMPCSRALCAAFVASMLAAAPARAGGDPDLVFFDGFEDESGSEPPPPPPCTIDPPTPPAGYLLETPPARFPEVPLVVPLGFFMGDFPQSGGGQGRVTPLRERYFALRFVAPVDVSAYEGLARQFVWQEAQQAGFSVNLNAIYVSVTQCAGDFRIPPAGQTAPVGDPTFASGCRNYRPFVQNGSPLFFRQIDYAVTSAPSNFSTCSIVPGNTYYFNFILASPVGGITPGENPCTNQQSTRCGIQMSIQ